MNFVPVPLIPFHMHTYPEVQVGAAWAAGAQTIPDINMAVAASAPDSLLKVDIIGIS
ncbi:MAG: hypothetical protein ACLR2M_03885 [Varibaculum sp.]